MSIDLSTKQKRSDYVAAHMWMKYHFGKPQVCEQCKTAEDRMYHWANISGTYRREREDWLRLCVPCHKGNDIKALGGKIRARPKMLQPSKPCSECGTEFIKNPRLSAKQWSEYNLCGRECRAIVQSRRNKGVKQPAETCALKSRKLQERWATNKDWREHMTTRMMGNKYAIGRKDAVN